jgi:hypothetical protein
LRLSIQWEIAKRISLEERNMPSTPRNRAWLVVVVAVATGLCALGSYAAPTRPQQPAQTAQATAGARPIGTIKSISSNSITLASDAGPIFTISVQDSARLVRIEPGEKDLKNAQPVQLQDLQVGDRILATGKVSDDGHSVSASSIIVMKKADVETKQQHDLQDWQRRGTGGLVSAVDQRAGTIAISTTSLAGTKTITIHTSKDTILRRYAPGSVKFDDAKPSSLAEVKVGDQVRARGTRSADGSDLVADEIVSGSFRNIAGTVSSIDASANIVNVMDLITKKPVIVNITPQSQLRKLSPQAAQFIAMRLNGGQAGADGNTPGNSAAGGAPGSGSASGSPSGAVQSNGASTDRPAGRGPGGGRGGDADLQQVLSRMPPSTLSDIQKGDAVMIISTEGPASGSVTAITLVSGVEALLQASPSGGSQSMILPPWSLDAPSGDAVQ